MKRLSEIRASSMRAAAEVPAAPGAGPGRGGQLSRGGPASTSTSSRRARASTTWPIPRSSCRAPWRGSARRWPPRARPTGPKRAEPPRPEDTERLPELPRRDRGDRQARLGLMFPHKNHVVGQKLDCATCHSNARRHGELTATKASCAPCHHQDPKRDCAECHPFQKTVYEGGAVPGDPGPQGHHGRSRGRLRGLPLDKAQKGRPARRRPRASPATTRATGDVHRVAGLGPRRRRRGPGRPPRGSTRGALTKREKAGGREDRGRAAARSTWTEARRPQLRLRPGRVLDQALAAVKALGERE